MASTSSNGVVLRFNYVVQGTRKCDRGAGNYVLCTRGFWVSDGSDSNCSRASTASDAVGRGDPGGNTTAAGDAGDTPEKYCFCTGRNADTKTGYASRLFGAATAAECASPATKKTFIEGVQKTNRKMTHVNTACRYLEAEEARNLRGRELVFAGKPEYFGNLFPNEIDLGERLASAAVETLPRNSCRIDSRIVAAGKWVCSNTRMIACVCPGGTCKTVDAKLRCTNPSSYVGGYCSGPGCTY
jgi:hypothetical protein